MQKIFPFLWFDNQAEEAVRFYTSLFKSSKISAITPLGEDVPGPKGNAMTISFQLAGQDFMALNGGPVFSFTPAVSFFVTCQTPEEIDGLWNALSAGGSVLMELNPYPFSEKYGWVIDRYGIAWQLNLARRPQKIAPFLLFVGDHAGQAEKAINFYTSLFKNSSISQIERYGAGQPEPEGTIVHSRFSLEGEEFMAMDSSLEHAFTFTPAISFYVNCDSQAEVDDLWATLSSNGGRTDQCGWLQDQFGISWQIVPTILGEYMTGPDAEKAHNVTQAMLKMSKLDIAVLQKAYEEG